MNRFSINYPKFKGKFRVIDVYGCSLRLLGVFEDLTQTVSKGNLLAFG